DRLMVPGCVATRHGAPLDYCADFADAGSEDLYLREPPSSATKGRYSFRGSTYLFLKPKALPASGDLSSPVEPSLLSSIYSAGYGSSCPRRARVNILLGT